MWQGALALIPGFVLTVLIGGAYASYLQQRSWRHQNQSRLDEEERKQAGEIRTALSELLDKRRYRTVRVLQAIEDRARNEGSDDELRDRRSEYEQALADWNDQLTTRLVSVEVYFGRDVHDQLKDIDLRFRETDGEVEKFYRQLVATPDAASSIDGDDVATTSKRLDDALGEWAYELGLTMMRHLRRGDVGYTTRQQRPSPAATETTATAPKPTSTASGNGPSALTAVRGQWSQGPSVAIASLGVFWVICMSLPLWDWPGGDFSGWQLLTGSGTLSDLQWGWLPALAMLAIAVLAAATLTQRWSRYRAVTQYSAIAVGAVSVVTLVALGVDATDSFRSYCGTVDAAYKAECLSAEGLGFGYYLCIATAVLTTASGLWAAIQSQQKRNKQPLY